MTYQLAWARRLTTYLLLVALAAVIFVLVPPPAGAQGQPSIIINEFMASNANTLPDNTGDFEDWIELHNTSGAAVSMAGWTIQDGGETFTFPAGFIVPAAGYQVIFASGDVSRTTASELHLPFKLTADGERLLLRDALAQISSPAWPASYPAQLPDFSYGNGAASTQLFFPSPTPGAANNGGGSGVVDDVTFSLPHGFYDTRQTLVLDTTTPETGIRYTLDGSTPTATNGRLLIPGSSIAIRESSNVRAIAFRAGWVDSPVETRSYLFVDDIIDQAETAPPGWPEHLEVNEHHFYYGMDPNDVDPNPQLISDALLAVPSISITTDLENLFDPTTGIYVNPLERGSEWERPASIELIDPTGAEPGFGINAGLRIRGNSSRRPDNPKHSLRLFFRNEYGDGELEYPLFGDEGVDSFAKIDLRTAQSWSWQRLISPRAGRGDASTWIRDVWNRDTQGAMGNAYTRSRSYHLYINGQYWGIYESEERVSEDYGEDYFGGSDFDVIKRLTDAFTSTATEGTYDAWAQLWPIVSDLQVTDAEFATLDSQVDLENLADYYLLHFFGGDGDGAPRRTLTVANNWLAFRERNGVGGAGKWTFMDRDSESALCHSTPTENQAIAPDIDMTPPWMLTIEPDAPPEFSLHPGYLHEALITHPGYVQIFRDSVQRHMLTAGGALTVPQMVARHDARADVIRLMIDAEAARWGDSVIEPGFGRSDWDIAEAVLRDCYAFRTTIVEEQLREDGMWPLGDPPTISPAGGPTPFGTAITVEGDGQAGTLYFTTDGTDPRTPSGAVNPTATVYAGPIPITGGVTITARFNDGGLWTPPTTETYQLSTTAGPVPLVLNEYNAVSSSQFLGGGTAAQTANGTDATFGRVPGNGGDWIELVVIEQGLDLRGYTVAISHIEDDARQTSASLTFSNDEAFANLLAGTVVTISEDIADDLSYSPQSGDWHINLQSNDQASGAYITAASQSNFVINNDDTQIVLLAPDGSVAALATGEGIAPDVAVNTSEVFGLEAAPTADLSPFDTAYQDGTNSSWGLPNRSGNAQIQDLDQLRVLFGDVNCSGTLTVADALFVAQFSVGLRTPVNSCPLPDDTSIYAVAADLNGDGKASVADSVLIAQCTVGFVTEFCNS